ncbi:MAG: hypothetical protein GF383_04720 [Candidatus Lokiarchaeota archaeon]|nr:hypothetical protein [Candidatus Lokiarchaeota archaeon]MBD3339099.1 hypothetical protein [Candidatus Lokiarchaeota archaeon]
MTISSVIVAKMVLFFVNLIHKPKEGVFTRSKKDKDYCYWSLRSVIKKWPFWLARQVNIPLLEKFALKMFGVRVSRSNALHEGWTDAEFIKFGKNIRLGQGSVIMSNILIGEKLIIKKVQVKDNVIIGAHSLVSPGTTIGENTILDATSMTSINQQLKKNSIYRGAPAKKIMENKLIKNIDSLKKKIFESDQPQYDDETLTASPQQLSIPFQAYIISGWLIIGGSYVLPGFLFIFYFFGYLEPNLLTIPFNLSVLFELKTMIILLMTPLVLVGIYLLHLFFIALITRLIYRFADKRGPEQGLFDRNLSESSKKLDYYHFRSFLMKYPVFAFIRSPFPWLTSWELRFIGSNEIGKGTVIEESYIHSHINFGRDCYYGTFSHISNHLVDGVYGEENLTFFGAEIGDNCVFNSLTGGMPGLEVGKDVTFLPGGTTIKYDEIGSNGVYAGFPIRRLSKEEIKAFTGGTIENE